MLDIFLSLLLLVLWWRITNKRSKISRSLGFQTPRSADLLDFILPFFYLGNRIFSKISLFFHTIRLSLILKEIILC